MPTLQFSKAKLSANVFEVTTKIRKTTDWEFWTLLTSDRHWDNPHSDRKMQKKHLELAKERGAAVLDFGDFFCAMQGKFDKRADKSALRPEHQVDNYFDKIVDDAANFFSPYSENIVFIGRGNHEDSIRKKHEIDLIERVTTLMSYKSKSPVHNGGFSGFCLFKFTDGEIAGSDGEHRRVRNRITLHYDHGYGGGGPVTRDMIQHQRRAVYLPDADIIVSGHTHDKWTFDLARKRVTAKGAIYHDVQTHIKIPTYKDDYGDGFSGWHATTGKPPKPLGAYWLRFWYCHKDQMVHFEPLRAS